MPKGQQKGPRQALKGGNASMDARSEKNLASLLPEVQSKFRAFVEEAQALAVSKGLQYVVICGTRTYQEQAALYRRGRDIPGPKVTNAPPGYSMHNFGLAIDMGVFEGKSYLDSDKPAKADAFHKAASAIAAKHGIRWGGNFKSIVDAPHFELDTKISLAELRNRKETGKPLLG